MNQRVISRVFNQKFATTEKGREWRVEGVRLLTPFEFVSCIFVMEKNSVKTKSFTNPSSNLWRQRQRKRGGKKGEKRKKQQLKTLLTHSPKMMLFFFSFSFLSLFHDNSGVSL